MMNDLNMMFPTTERPRNQVAAVPDATMKAEYELKIRELKQQLDKLQSEAQQTVRGFL